MSSSITDPSTLATSVEHGSSPTNKGKSKALNKDKSMEVDEDDDEDDDEDEEIGSEEDEESEVEESLEEIDPTAIVGRRTRGVRVDYTSKEALEKAGLQENDEDEDKEEDVEMKA